MTRRRTAILAALLLLVLVSFFLWQAVRRLGPDGAQPTIRPVTTSHVHAERAVLLAWEGGGPPFHVTILEPDGAVFWRSQRLSRPLVEVPRPISLRLRLETMYRWEVQAVDAMGRTFRSPLFPLTVISDPSLARPEGE